jgi:hypothetical protein
MIPTSFIEVAAHKFEANVDLPGDIALSHSIWAAPLHTTFHNCFSGLHLSSDLVTRHNAAETVPGINHYHHGKNENEKTETAWKEIEEVSSFSNDASL